MSTARTRPGGGPTGGSGYGRCECDVARSRSCSFDGPDRSQRIDPSEHRPELPDPSGLGAVGTALSHQPIDLVVVTSLECRTPTIDRFTAGVEPGMDARLQGHARSAFPQRTGHTAPPVTIRRNQGPEQRNGERSCSPDGHRTPGAPFAQEHSNRERRHHHTGNVPRGVPPVASYGARAAGRRSSRRKSCALAATMMVDMLIAMAATAGGIVIPANRRRRRRPGLRSGCRRSPTRDSGPSCGSWRSTAR